MTTEGTDSPQSPQAFTAPCSECQAGILRLQYITYFTWLNDELVTVPNFPAWVCDVCGRREYDPRAVNWLNTLLHPETGRRKNFVQRDSYTRPSRPERPRP